MESKTRTVAYGGLLIALSVILTRVFSAPIHIAGFYAIRLGLGGIPIILSGILLGPWAGAATGALADIIGVALFPMGAFFPGFTLTSALSGFIPALVVRRNKRKHTYLTFLIAIGLTDLITSVFLNTLWLSMMSGTSFLVFFVPRLITSAILIPIYSFVIYGLLKYYHILMPSKSK